MTLIEKPPSKKNRERKSTFLQETFEPARPLPHRHRCALSLLPHLSLYFTPSASHRLLQDMVEKGAGRSFVGKFYPGIAYDVDYNEKTATVKYDDGYVEKGVRFKVMKPSEILTEPDPKSKRSIAFTAPVEDASVTDAELELGEFARTHPSPLRRPVPPASAKAPASPRAAVPPVQPDVRPALHSCD